LVAASSSSAQRAATLIHKRAINKAVEDGQWKLAVKLLELMLERSLKPSPAVWKSIITCCAKNEKSKKATALLLDWVSPYDSNFVIFQRVCLTFYRQVKLAEAGEIEKPPISVFNNIVNACEICNEQELTLLVLDAMKKTHDIDGNIITFNIALKRLAKQGNVAACEGIIIGMLQQGIEPSVVSYTTAIAACATEGRKNPTYAYEWLKRMRSRNVKPNKITYNTALAACLDGKVESTILASKIATEMLEDVDNQLAEGIVGNEYTNVIPDYFTKATTREIMMQLRDNWQNGEIDKAVAKATIRKPLLEMVEFSKSERAAAAIEQASAAKAGMKEEEDLDATQRDEAELEYATVSNMHRTAEV
jgi:pentatricopeptide repeat protein